MSDHLYRRVPCPGCDGTGLLWPTVARAVKPCGPCNGQGFIYHPVAIEITAIASGYSVALYDIPFTGAEA